MKLKFLFTIIIMALLAACGGSEAPVVEVPAVENEIDVAALPVDIDVDTVASIREREDVFMLDVREQWEYDEGHLPNITLMPMGTIPDNLSQLPKDKEIVVTCRSGNRSNQITNYLQEQGFTNVHNMQGGILAWEAAGYDVDR